MSSKTSEPGTRSDPGTNARRSARSGRPPRPEPSPPGRSQLAAPQSGLDLDQRLWRDLFSLSKREADDRRLLRQLLGRWCSRYGFEAALYGELDGGYRLRIRVGKTDFPEDVEADQLSADGAPIGGWDVLRLPQGLLLCARPGRDDELHKPSAADLMLLAAGSWISELKRRIQEQSFQARFRGVELEALFDVGLAIASTLDLEKLCDEVLIRAVSLLDARRGALYLLEEGEYRLTSRFGGVALETFAADEIDPAGLDCGDFRGPEGWLPGASHLLAVAVEIERDPRGLLVVADKESRHGVGPFLPTDRRTLSLFATQAAIALENAKLHRLALEKERLEREMELASDIQKQILPKAMPRIPGFEAIGWNRPARQVGGDYYDVQALEHGRWGLVVGDVTGKGMPAALLVSTLHSALRVLLDRMEIGPALIERLNRHIYESSSSNKFITLLLAALDADSSRLAYLNAGHNPGLLIRRNGDVEELPSSGLPLGLLPKGKYGVSTLDLASGDLVCLYSDGITECESPQEEEFGLGRLVDLLRESRTDPLDRVLGRIDRAVTDFAQGRPQGDDQTVVLLRRCG